MTAREQQQQQCAGLLRMSWTRTACITATNAVSLLLPVLLPLSLLLLLVLSCVDLCTDLCTSDWKVALTARSSRTAVPTLPAAAAAACYAMPGWEVASTARSSRTTEYQASLGSRAPGDNGVFDAVRHKDRNRHRKLLQHSPAVAWNSRLR